MIEKQIKETIERVYGRKFPTHRELKDIDYLTELLTKLFTEQLHKPDVSSRLSIEELIWQKQNSDEPFNADEFYDWAAENSRQALDFAFDIYRELWQINGC